MHQLMLQTLNYPDTTKEESNTILNSIQDGRAFFALLTTPSLKSVTHTLQ